MSGEEAAVVKPRKTVTITAVEDDEDDREHDDVIPGPPPEHRKVVTSGGKEHSQGSASASTLGNSNRLTGIMGKLGVKIRHRGQSVDGSEGSLKNDPLQLSVTDHNWAGGGILASRADLNMSFSEFAAGCNLLQAAALGDIAQMENLLRQNNNLTVDFRDYDRRTALHVAASEGHLHVCKFLIEKYNVRINRSDRWGGSPLDDAHRHQHKAVIQYLRDKGATTGSGNRSTNLIQAAAAGDLDEVRTFLQHVTKQQKSPSPTMGGSNQARILKNAKLDINKGDYDNRTALHLAASENHLAIVQLLIEKGADVNVQDRWGRTPLDGATDSDHAEIRDLLIAEGANEGTSNRMNLDPDLDSSHSRSINNMKIDFKELQLIDRIGSGAFGEIYKCRWRGTLVAAKIIKTAKIRRDWLRTKAMNNINNGGDVDEAIREMDEAEMSATEKELALTDFRQEISVVKSLRHPNIVLMLAYSTTERYECLISELCKCSLLDVFKAHTLQGTKFPRRLQYVYAQQLAQGMNYLHTCNPPIIHRDLKPANLLIDHSGTLKISDFGLSKVRPNPKNEGETDTYIMTGETGSYRFMAPEVYRHQSYNETVDVYSFAMIFFFLLVGKAPWAQLPGLEAVQKASQGDRPIVPRDLDARTVNLLKECWHDEPNARPSFQRILDFLHAYSEDVFHSDVNNVAVASSPEFMIAESNCQCIIL